MQLTQDQRDLLVAFTEDVGKAIDRTDPNARYKPAQVLAALVAALLLDDTNDYKAGVRVTTVGALPAYTRTGNYLNANANGALNDTGIDGVTDLAVGDRVLVMHGTGADRGIYLITDLGGASSKWQFTRASDAAATGDLSSGSRVSVEEGTAAAKTFILTTANPITLNTTSQTWTEQSSSVTAVAVLAALAAGADAKDVGGGKVTNMADGTAATDALTLRQLNKRLQSVATTAAMTALALATLADKALVYVEDTDQIFHYDADSAAVVAAGPPATCLQPDGAGAGRFLLHDPAARIIRVVADTAAVQALKVDSLVDRAFVYVESLKQLFAYDAGSVAAEALGPPVSVIAPTAGDGRFLALSNPPAAFTWSVEAQASDPGAGDNLPAAADSTFLNSNKMLKRIPTKGILKVWYLGAGAAAGIDNNNTVVFKVIKLDDTALITKTFDTATQPDGVGTPTLLGTSAVAEGDMIGWEAISFDVANPVGGTGNLPIFNLQFDITPVA